MYRLNNLDSNIFEEFKREMPRAIKDYDYREQSQCYDLCFDDDLVILRIHDGDITVDLGAQLFTIPYDSYVSLKIY